MQTLLKLALLIKLLVADFLTSSGLMHRRLRFALIVTEVALSVVLLVGAGLLVRSVLHSHAFNTGFNSGQTVNARLSASGSDSRNDEDYVRSYDRAMLRLTNIPGVEDVADVNTLPPAKGPTLAFRIDGREMISIDKWPPANYRSTGPQYVRIMNIPNERGDSLLHACAHGDVSRGGSALRMEAGSGVGTSRFVSLGTEIP